MSRIKLEESCEQDSRLAARELELFQKIFYETVGVQQQLPPHNIWTDARLRLAEGFEIMRARRLRPFLSVTRNLRHTAIDLQYSGKSFVLKNLNEFQSFVRRMPIEARRLPLSIEVGLWGSSPRKTWAMAKSLNIETLTLVLQPNTNINSPTQHRNDIEYLHGNKDLRNIQGIQAVKLIWVLKTGGVGMYKSHWVNTKAWVQKLQIITRSR